MKMLILAFALGSCDRLSWMIVNSQLGRGDSRVVNLHKLEGLRFCGRVQCASCKLTDEEYHVLVAEHKRMHLLCKDPSQCNCLGWTKVEIHFNGLLCSWRT